MVSCLILGQAYYQERGERQRLERRIALLEQLMNRFEKRSERQGGEAPSKATAPPVAPPPIDVSGKRQEKVATAEARAPESHISARAESNPQPVESAAERSGEPPAKIDDAKISSLEENRGGFRLDFKLVNLVGEPIAGNVAIIAALKPPHQPRFVSFPSMRLVDGMPVKLRKSVGYNIRYYKYVTGRFYFPFSYSDSFRILVYNQDEQLIVDSTLSAEDMPVSGLLSEEPAPTLTPADPSLSS